MGTTIHPVDSISLSKSESRKELLPIDDLLEESIGSFGRFQCIILILLSAPILCVAIQAMSWTFVSSEVIYPNDTSIFYEWGVPQENVLQIKASIQASYFVGQLIGAYYTGILGDRYGRKFATYVTLVLQGVCSLLPSFAPNWWTFALLKVGTGFAEAGLYGVSILFVLEILGKSHRRLSVIAATFFYVLGMLSIPLTAYFVRNHRLFNAILATPSFVFMMYWWAIPESPRWLIAKGRFTEAEQIIRNAARMNGKTLPKDWISQLDTSQITPKIQETPGVVALFRTPEMRKRILVSTLIWPTGSMLYYGMSMKSDLNGDSLYLSFALTSLVEVPGTLISYFLINSLGRRLLMSTSMLACGLLLLLNWALSTIAPHYILLSLLLLCKMGATCISNVGYIHVPEMMPTLLRTTASGYCGAVARVGSIFCSYISLWLVDSYGMLALILPFSVCSLISGVFAQLYLPETHGQPLPETVDDVEKTRIQEKVYDSTEKV